MKYKNHVSAFMFASSLAMITIYTNHGPGESGLEYDYDK